MLRIGAIGVAFSCIALSGCGTDRFVIVGPPQTYQLAVQAFTVNSSLTKQTIANLVVTQ
jgi:hypothetical protein